jgi:thiamine pyrophosphokinase
MHKAFWEHLGQHPYRSILALHGDLPDKSFFQSVDLPIIAADGSVNLLYPIGIKPHVVLGDLDSAQSEWIQDLKVVRDLNQNQCDFEKSLHYASSFNLLPTIVVGMGGGYLDHVLNNLSIFATSKAIFYSPPLVGYVLNEKQSQTFSLPIQTKISLFGMPSAEVSSQGLKWELEHSELTLTKNTSAFNRTLTKDVQITVHSGLVYVMIYLESHDDCGMDKNSY